MDDNANDTDAPMIWLDGLDTPLVRMLEAGFHEVYHQERQDFGAAVNASRWHYPMAEMRAALQRLADTRDAGEEIVLEYQNRQTGGPVMPTISCHVQLLRPGEKTKASRRVCRTNYHLVERVGYSIVGDQRLDWEDKDVFTVPTWTFCEHVNSSDRPAFLFSFSDAPVMKALSLYRHCNWPSARCSRKDAGSTRCGRRTNGFTARSMPRWRWSPRPGRRTARSLRRRSVHASPAITALAITTLDDIANGRVLPGLGAGVSGFGELGIRPRKPPRAIHESIEVIRALLRGKQVDMQGEVISFQDGLP